MSGNGVDIAAVYQLLSQVAESVVRHDKSLANIDRRLANIDQRVMNIEQTLVSVRAEQTDLRQAVTHYHSSVIGHGILISDLEARMRRVEERLDLSPLPAG